MNTNEKDTIFSNKDLYGIFGEIVLLAIGMKEKIAFYAAILGLLILMIQFLIRWHKLNQEMETNQHMCERTDRNFSINDVEFSNTDDIDSLHDLLNEHQTYICKKKELQKGKKILKKQMKECRVIVAGCMILTMVLLLFENETVLADLSVAKRSISTLICELMPQTENGQENEQENEEIYTDTKIIEFVVETEYEQTPETEVTVQEKRKGKTEEVVFNPNCTMKLDIGKKQMVEFEAADNQDRTEKERVYFGLWNLNTIEMHDDEIYAYVERGISAAVNLNHVNTIENANNIEYEKQVEINSVTIARDRFWEDVNSKRNNPPGIVGTENWYNLLPAASSLIASIEIQEKYLRDYPDCQFAQMLYMDYLYLGNECCLQNFNESNAIYYYEKAALNQLKRLEFEDCTEENMIEELNNLRYIYSSLASEDFLSDDNPVKIKARTIVRMIERYIDENV